MSDTIRRAASEGLTATDVTPFLPTRTLPPTSFAGISEVEWLDLDWEGSYQRRGHPEFGEHDIKYCFNEFGYRCPKFDTAADIRIVSAGCSYVMGIGLPQKVLFHERFAARLGTKRAQTVVNWNLALPGASNDYICRILFLALPVLNPDIVLVNFTHPGRREYVSLEGKLASYNPGVSPSDLKGIEICGHFNALCSPPDDVLNLFRNYKAVEALLSGRVWLFSAIQSDAFDSLISYVDRTHYVGYLSAIDLARDHAHPGALSHLSLSELYWEGFMALQLKRGGVSTRAIRHQDASAGK